MTFVFDMGGVLIDLDPHACIRNFTALMDTSGGLNVSAADLLGNGGKTPLGQYELGLITTRQLLDYFHTLSRPEVTDEQLRAAWLSMTLTIPESRKALVRRLHRQGHTVFLLSNINEMHWDYIRPMFQQDGFSLDDYFDRLFLSNELHMVKPQEQVYDLVMSYVPQGDEVVYVDDLEHNRLPGSRRGWRTFASVEQLAAAGY